MNNTFISNARLKLTKNQAKAKQHPESELFLLENCWLSSSTLSSKKQDIQSSPAISNSEGTGEKVRDSAIFEMARHRDSEITPGENSR